MPDQANPVKLKSRPAKYVGTYPNIYRYGQTAEIVGIRMVGEPPYERACFMLLYEDGMIDYTVIGEQNYATYELI